MAELLLCLRQHLLPAEYLDSVSNVGRARYDIWGIAELLAGVASRGDTAVKEDEGQIEVQVPEEDEGKGEVQVQEVDGEVQVHDG